MKKVTLILIALLAILVGGVAQASPVIVDFSSLGLNSMSITAPDSLTLSGVTFIYDNLGSTADTAQVDSSGVFGSTFGSLMFDFSAPATAMNFDFSLLGAFAPVSDGLSITLKRNGSDVTDQVIPASLTLYDPGNPSLGGDTHGTFSYSGPAFDQALMFFSLDTPYFSGDSLSYQPAIAPAPEPSAFAALAFGLLGLPGWRFARRKH